MALAFQQKKIHLKGIGRSVAVPDNARARLMYYLDCVCDALELDSSDTRNISRLRDYNSYWSLSEDEKNKLLVLCAILSPDILLNKVFFQSDEMCGDSLNAFYEIGTISNKMVVSQSILIGGQSRNVRQIMTFKMVWLRRFYQEPIQQLERDLELARQRQAQRRNNDGCIIL